MTTLGIIDNGVSNVAMLVLQVIPDKGFPNEHASSTDYKRPS